MIETLVLHPGVTLRCFRDSRFKHSCLSIQLVRPMRREEAALNAILPAVLLRGCRNYPDLRVITLRLDDLYGASVSALVRRIGDYQTTGLYCSFMDERYALDGDTILAPVIDLLRQLLLDPVTENGHFSAEIVESEKKNLISTIESELNDKRAYAAGQLLRAMCGSDSFGVPRLGDKENVAAIDAGALFSYYQRILRESPVELFYVGSAASEEMAALLTPLFKTDETRDPLPPQTPFHACEGQHLSETMDVTQAKLCMGFTTPITNRSAEFAAMQVFNTLYGAGMTCKLFMNVREKLSLCYAIGSGYYGSKGILTVSAGIDTDKDEVARQEIFRQLEACRTGDFTAQELEAAKEAIVSSIRAVHDAPGTIEAYYSTAALSGARLSLADYRAAVENTTAEQVAEAARSVQLHSSFILKGVTA